MARQTIEEIVKGLMPEAPQRVVEWARRYGRDCHLAWNECDQADVMGSMLVALHTKSQIVMIVLCECLESSYGFAGGQKIQAVEDALELARRWSLGDGVTLGEVSECLARLMRGTGVLTKYEETLSRAAHAMLVFATPAPIDHGGLVRDFLHSVIGARVCAVKTHGDVSDAVVADVVRRSNTEFCNRIRRLVSWDALAFSAMGDVSLLMAIEDAGMLAATNAFRRDLN